MTEVGSSSLARLSRLPIYEIAGMPQDMGVKWITDSQRQVKDKYRVEVEIVEI